MPTRLMAGLLYLKHSFNLRDEDVCERWSESPLWQFFSGQDYYEHLLPCDATQVGRFCDRLAHAPPPDGHLVKSGSGLRALALQRELSVGVAP